MLQDEQIISFGEAARLIPQVNGKSVHSTSVWRWARKGLRGVRLDCLRIGGRFCTSMEAVERFGKAMAELPTPNGNSAPPPARRRRRRRRRTAA